MTRTVKSSYVKMMELGNCHLAVAELAKARRCFARAAVLEPALAEPLVGLGSVELQLGNHEEAYRLLIRALEIDGRSAGACSGLAAVYQQRQDYRHAFDMYLRALEIQPENLLALLGLFQMSRRMGTFKQIIHYLEVYRKSHPDDAAVLFCLASLYVQENHLLRARELLLEVLDLEPGKPEANALLAQVHRAMLDERHPTSVRQA
jgi:tetratricopeptide (TPR) repeat protein